MRSKLPLSPAVIRDIQAALHGPGEETLVPCPVCLGCAGCRDTRLVSAARCAVLRARARRKQQEESPE